jgi:hypothetical protein
MLLAFQILLVRFPLFVLGNRVRCGYDLLGDRHLECPARSGDYQGTLRFTARATKSVKSIFYIKNKVDQIERITLILKRWKSGCNIISPCSVVSKENLFLYTVSGSIE